MRTDGTDDLYDDKKNWGQGGGVGKKRNRNIVRCIVLVVSRRATSCTAKKRVRVWIQLSPRHIPDTGIYNKNMKKKKCGG